MAVGTGLSLDSADTAPRLSTLIQDGRAQRDYEGSLTQILFEGSVKFNCPNAWLHVIVH